MFSTAAAPEKEPGVRGAEGSRTGMAAAPRRLAVLNPYTNHLEKRAVGSDGSSRVINTNITYKMKRHEQDLVISRDTGR